MKTYSLIHFHLMLSFLMLMFCCLAFAEGTEIKTSSIPISVIEKKNELEVDLSYDSDIMATHSENPESHLNLFITSTHNLSDESKILIRGGIIRDQSIPQNSSLQDTLISWSSKQIPIGLPLNSNNFKFTTSVFLPTNETKRNEDYFIGTVKAKGGLSHAGALLGRPVLLSYSIIPSKNFHRFEQNSKYDFNTSHGVAQEVFLSNNLAKKLNLNIFFNYAANWNYQNTMKTKFLLSEEMGWDIALNTTVYFSHSNGGQALQANGENSNIKFYNKNTSNLGIGIRAIF